MRVRIALTLALVLVLALLGAQISGSVPVLAGSNRVPPASFVFVLPPGSLLCQPAAPLPEDAASAVITLATGGRPLPAGRLRFLTASGAVFAEGHSQTGAGEGPVAIALRRTPGAPPASGLCLSFAAATRVVAGAAGPAALPAAPAAGPAATPAVSVAGAAVPPGPGTAVLDGKRQAAVISVTYLRGGKAESWWQSLPALSRRFGRGKAAIFGDWTLAACLLALAAGWTLAVRLLWRELR